MDAWLIGLLAIGTLLLALRLWSGPAPSVREERPPAPAASTEPEPLWSADTLARLGTSDTVAELVEQGRTDELRGLGYSGDLPASDRP